MRLVIVSVFVETLTMMATGATLAFVLSAFVLKSDWQVVLVALGMAVASGGPTLPPLLRWFGRLGAARFARGGEAESTPDESADTQAKLNGVTLGVLGEGKGKYIPHAPFPEGADAQTVIDDGRDIADLVGAAGLALQLDYSTDDKRALAIAMVQVGIDLAGVVRNGGRFLADGGSGSGRKFPVLFAGAMLQDRELMALAREAHDLNQGNGLLIRAQMKSSKQALAVLMSAAEQASTYGPDGQAMARTSSRSLGSA
mgnify:CR=1 FL=1